MRTYDLSPLFRTSVGFDRMSHMMDRALRLEQTAKGYPPYNIARVSDNNYRITLAVAGFAEEDLTITLKENILTVAGSRSADEQEIEYLHRGIAGRGFSRNYQLADHIRVKTANLENGLLHIALEREIPEALKPRTIAITSAVPQMEAAAK